MARFADKDTLERPRAVEAGVDAGGPSCMRSSRVRGAQLSRPTVPA